MSKDKNAERNYIDVVDSNSIEQEKKERDDKARVCAMEIDFILRSKPFIITRSTYWYDVSVSVAAYLVTKAFEYKNPFEVDYDTVIESVPEIIANAAKKDNLFYYWDELKKLIKKYPVDSFMRVACMENYSSPVKTPFGITQLVVNLLDITEKDSFADLCCGTGYVAKEIKSFFPDAEVYGYDKDEYPLAAAKVFDELTVGKIEFCKKDIFELAFEKQPKKFSKIFANYPFKMSLKDLEVGKEYLNSLEKRIPAMSKATSSDWLFNTLIVDMLAKDGKAIAVMTNGSTWNTIDAPIRKYFVENGLIQTVIALPGKIFNSTKLATSLVIFSNGNKGVRLVDASDLYVEGRRLNALSDEDINKILDSADGDSDISKYVTLEELRKNDYVLNYKRYDSSAENIQNGVPFDSVIKRITRGAPMNAKELDEITVSTPTDMQYVMLAHVKDGLIDKDLPYLKEIDPKNDKYCLTNHCLVLSKNGKPYKIAVAEISQNQRILANGNLYIIELNEEKVNPYYMAAFLSSERGTAALEGISVGTVMANIGVEQLKNLLIPLPSLEEQKIIADNYQTAKDEIKMLQVKLERAKNKMAHAFDEGGDF